MFHPAELPAALAGDPIHRVLLPALGRCLHQARHELELASRHAQAGHWPAARLWGHRLAPDMLNLSQQVEVLSDGVAGTLAHLGGRLDDPAAGRIFNRAEAALRVTELPDLAAALALMQPAMQALQDWHPGAAVAWLADTTQPVIVSRPGHVRRFERATFLWDYVLPNALFHATMIHALLRHAGVPLGKDDFAGPQVFTLVPQPGP